MLTKDYDMKFFLNRRRLSHFAFLSEASEGSITLPKVPLQIGNRYRESFNPLLQNSHETSAGGGGSVRCLSSIARKFGQLASFLIAFSRQNSKQFTKLTTDKIKADELLLSHQVWQSKDQS